MFALYPRLLSGDSALAAPEAAEDVEVEVGRVRSKGKNVAPAQVCFGVHAVHTYDISRQMVLYISPSKKRDVARRQYDRGVF